MLASITPLGQRGRGASWRRTVTAYVIGSVIGGAAVGALLGAAGLLAGGTSSAGAAVVGVGAVVAATLDVAGTRLPGIRRQVDETWLVRYRDWVHGVGFGLQLGLGAVTIVTSTSLYLTWLLELLVASTGSSAAVGAVFGLTRALPLLSTRRIVDAATLRTSHRRWQDQLASVRRATSAVMLATGAALLAVVAA